MIDAGHNSVQDVRQAGELVASPAINCLSGYTPTMERRLRDLGRKLSIAVRAADIGIWEWDLRMDEFTYSDRAKEIFGFGLDESVTRDRIIGVLHPDDHKVAKEQAIRSLDPTLQKRDPYRYRIFRADTGELRWIHAFGEPEFETVDDKLVPVGFVGTLQDVTDEVTAKERLENEEARLRLAIEASGIAVWELNLADQTLVHSPELNVLCGFPPDAKPSLEEFRSRYAPGERQRMEQEGAEARARGETKFQSVIHHIWPDGTEKWLSLRAQLAPGETNYGGRIIGVLIDVTDQKKREEEQALLVKEFKHRIKNSFAVVQALIGQSLRGEDLSEEARSKLFSRLQAMADAHDVIARGSWEKALLAEVLGRVRWAFDGNEDRVEVRMEEVELSPRAALSFSLVFHELFTNAVKYGALSTAAGQIVIEVRRHSEGDNALLMLEWTETGGPPVQISDRLGFGTRLIERVFSAEFDAKVQRDFNTEGLTVRINVPSSKVAPVAIA